MQSETPLDLAIIGGGLAGLIQLHYARRAGLQALVLEREGAVGGLWRRLPAWQDLQVSLADFVVGDFALAGPMQSQVLAYVESWVERFALTDGIRVDSPVHRARHTGSFWELDTPAGIVRARHLVEATGGHNKPIIPTLARDRSTVSEFHSSALRDPETLKQRDVVVVGGGASAFDLLELCLSQEARRISWVYRDVRWFSPTRKPKAIAGTVRPFAKLQAEGMSVAEQSATIGADLVARYAKFGIQAIQPPHSLDVRRDQLIPGRSRMLADFGAIERYPGTTIESITGGNVTLADGTRLAPDIVLWGTGYETDLSYFEDARIAEIRNVAELGSRCACQFRSLDAPDLYFPSPGLDGIGALSWSYALMARSVVSHIRGEAKLDMEPHSRLNHLEIARHIVERDPGSQSDDAVWDFYRDMALRTPDDEPYPMP
jgi:cation diffusion facilitator CzcD-associated flavoprotein CzcO